MFGCLRATVELLQRCRVRGVARHKGVRVDTKIVLNWLLASTATNTSQIGVNFKQTEHEEGLPSQDRMGAGWLVGS